MGIEVRAACGCGYQVSELRVGGGKYTKRENDTFPALCGGCNKAVSVKMCGQPLECPDCGSTDVTFYSDPALQGEPGPLNVAQDFDMRINSGTYKCPKCGEYGLMFAISAFFD